MDDSEQSAWVARELTAENRGYNRAQQEQAATTQGLRVAVGDLRQALSTLAESRHIRHWNGAPIEDCPDSLCHRARSTLAATADLDPERLGERAKAAEAVCEAFERYGQTERQHDKVSQSLDAWRALAGTGEPT